jgi:hypothetical protein
MKIFNNDKELVYSGKFSADILDLEHTDNWGDALRIPIIDKSINAKMQDLAWSFGNTHDWIAVDDDKTNVYLYINRIDEDISIILESFPYLPCDKDIKFELNGIEDNDERLSVQGYYDEIKDWLSENNCGEMDCVDVEFNEDELDLFQSIADKLF